MGAEYALTGIFGRLAGQHGLLTSLVAVAFLAIILVLVPVVIYYARAKVDLMRAESDGANRERARREERDEKERQALITEIGAARRLVEEQAVRLHAFMTNHLEHDRMERDALGAVLTETKSAIQAIAQDLRGHRDEEAKRAASVFEDLRDISTQVQVLAAKIPPPAQRAQ